MTVESSRINVTVTSGMAAFVNPSATVPEKVTYSIFFFFFTLVLSVCAKADRANKFNMMVIKVSFITMSCFSLFAWHRGDK